jgi:hypothetical protein
LLDSSVQAPVIQAAAITNISTSEVVDEFGELDALLGEANTDELVNLML